MSISFEPEPARSRSELQTTMHAVELYRLKAMLGQAEPFVAHARQREPEYFETNSNDS